MKIKFAACLLALVPALAAAEEQECYDQLRFDVAIITMVEEGVNPLINASKDDPYYYEAYQLLQVIPEDRLKYAHLKVQACLKNPTDYIKIPGVRYEK